MASYDETLVSITLDAHPDIVVDTTHPQTQADPTGGSRASGFQYRFVQISGDHQVNLYANASDEVAVGVLQSKPQIDNQEATVAVAGVSLVECGGTVTAGDVITPDDTGRATTGGTGSPAGIALYGGAEGEIVPVLLRLTTAGSTTA